MENVILSSVPLNQLLGEFRAIIKEEIKAELSKEEEQLVSPEMACNLFNPKISTKTLGRWSKEGLIQSHRLGGKVLYKKSEIIASLASLRKYHINKAL